MNDSYGRDFDVFAKYDCSGFLVDHDLFWPIGVYREILHFRHELDWSRYPFFREVNGDKRGAYGSRHRGGFWCKVLVQNVCNLSCGREVALMQLQFELRSWWYGWGSLFHNRSRRNSSHGGVID